MSPGTGATWSGYLAYIDDGYQAIYRVTDSDATPLYEGTASLPTLASGDVLALTAIGTTLTMTFRGVAIASVTDATYTHGLVGIANPSAADNLAYSAVAIVDRPAS
jgi:hypothetical protein